MRLTENGNIQYKVNTTNSAKVVFKNRYSVYVNDFSPSTVIDLKTDEDITFSEEGKTYLILARQLLRWSE
jgi:hypothetical protein